MKVKIKNKFEEMKPRQGTIAKGESRTDASQAADADIYECLKKYGISTLVNKTQATEFLYLDNTNRNMTLDEAVRMRNNLEDYFKQQPARVRKVFGDNVDMFIEKYNARQFDDFLSTGVLNDELVKQLTEGDSNNEQVAKNPISTEGVSTNPSQGNTGTMAGTDGRVQSEQHGQTA